MSHITRYVILGSVIAILGLSGCASQPTLTMPLIEGNSVSSLEKPTVQPPETEYLKGYKAALDNMQRELANTGPYSLTMSPEPAYRGPVYLRVYLNRMRIGRTYYPEGWYEVEATPGSPGGTSYSR